MGDRAKGMLLMTMMMMRRTKWLWICLLLSGLSLVSRKRIQNPKDRVTTTITGGEQDDNANGGSNLAFVIGNGRTGTNWLGRILISHKDVIGENERKPEFRSVTDLAVYTPLLNRTAWDRKFQRVVQQYQRRSSETRDKRKRYHSDKSHPALFFAPKLRDAFPNSKFVGIHRCLYPTVASCVRHDGVSAWFNETDLTSTPNKFLGITQDNIQQFRNMPLHVHCALRWAFHQLEYEHVVPVLKSNLLMLNYRIMSLQPQQEFAKLQSFLGLTTPFTDAPIGHPFDPIAWKTKLTSQQRREIDDELAREGLSHLVSTYCDESERT